MLASVSSWSYRDLFADGTFDLLSFLDEVKRLGADGFEIFPRHLNADDVPGHLAQVTAKADDLGLSIASLITGNNFAMAAAADRAAQVEQMKDWIRYAADAGIARLNTFTGYHNAGTDPELENWRVVDGYREVAPLAEERGVLLCVENHSTVCPGADGLMAMIRAADSDAMRTNPDFTNFVPEFYNRSERSLEAMYRETARVAPLAANAHLKVRDFTEEGDACHVDVARLLKILTDVGYDAHIVLEYYGRGGDPRESCEKGIALLKRLF